MNIDRFILAFAGFVVMASVVLGVWVHEYWFFLTAFVGLNMFQAAFTGFCPLAILLKNLGLSQEMHFRSITGVITI